MKKQNSGFTLVEIAIVLVIIGLLIGGVLKGQEMINNAKLKRVVNDFEGIAAAIFSYQDRYRVLPGDDSGAGRWSVAVGDADGAVEGDWNSANSNDESRKFWLHLRNSNLTAGDVSDDSLPTNAYGGPMGVMSNNYGMTGVVVCMGNIDGSNAEIIDTQLDDGVPNTGSVRASSTAAVDTAGSGTYNVANTYFVCRKI